MNKRFINMLSFLMHMSNYGELCLRFEGQKYIAWAKAHQLEFDRGYIGGIFTKENGIYKPVVKDGETHLNRDKKGFVTMLLHSLDAPPFPIKDFVYYIDFDNEEIFEIKDNIMGPIKGHTSILKHKYVSQEEVNEKLLEDLVAEPNHMFKDQVLVALKCGGAGPYTGYLDISCLDFLKKHPSEVFYKEIETGQFKPMYPEFGPLTKTKERYNVDFISGLSQRMKPPTIPFQPVVFFIDFDNIKFYQLDSFENKINLPEFIERNVVDKETMKKMLFKEESEMDRWMFLNLYFQSVERQGGPKVILAGDDISPFRNKEEGFNSYTKKK